jgi:hypothetical protein
MPLRLLFFHCAVERSAIMILLVSGLATAPSAGRPGRLMVDIDAVATDFPMIAD